MLTHAPLHFEVVQRTIAAPTESGAPAGVVPRSYLRDTGTGRHSPGDSRTRILIVEDGLIVAEDLRRRCESLGYRVDGVRHTGPEAVEAAGQLQPDIILMDIGLRGTMDGIEAARRIRDGLAIPVVYATAYSDDATLGRAKSTEPAGFLLKPISSRDLRTTIELALHRHHQSRNIHESETHRRILMEAVSDALVIVDASGSISDFNGRAASLLGRNEASEIEGKDLFDFLAPSDRDRVADRLHDLFASGTVANDPWRVALRSGNSRSLWITIFPLPDQTRGGASALLVLRPFPLSDHAGPPPPEADPVLQQLRNRISSQLGLIGSLLHLQTEGIEDETVLCILKQTETRIKVLGLVNQELPATETVELGALVSMLNRLVALLTRTYGVADGLVRCRTEVERLQIGPDRALACALIAHELLTAAIQSASPKERILLTVVASRPGQVELVVKPCRQGRNGSPPGDSVGLEFMRMLVRLLGGTAHLEGDARSVSFGV